MNRFFLLIIFFCGCIPQNENLVSNSIEKLLDKYDCNAQYIIERRKRDILMVDVIFDDSSYILYSHQELLINFLVLKLDSISNQKLQLITMVFYNKVEKEIAQFTKEYNRKELDKLRETMNPNELGFIFLDDLLKSLNSEQIATLDISIETLNKIYPNLYNSNFISLVTDYALVCNSKYQSNITKAYSKLIELFSLTDPRPEAEIQGKIFLKYLLKWKELCNQEVLAFTIPGSVAFKCD